MEGMKNLTVLNGEERGKCFNIEWTMKKEINWEKVSLDRIEVALVSRKDELMKKEFHSEEKIWDKRKFADKEGNCR